MKHRTMKRGAKRTRSINRLKRVASQKWEKRTGKHWPTGLMTEKQALDITQQA